MVPVVALRHLVVGVNSDESVLQVAWRREPRLGTLDSIESRTSRLRPPPDRFTGDLVTFPGVRSVEVGGGLKRRPSVGEDGDSSRKEKET